MGVKFFEIPGQRVPLKFSNKKAKTSTLNTNGHARHKSACTKGKIRMFIVNANIEEKQEKYGKQNDKEKEREPKEQEPKIREIRQQHP